MKKITVLLIASALFGQLMLSNAVGAELLYPTVSLSRDGQTFTTTIDPKQAVWNKELKRWEISVYIPDSSSPIQVQSAAAFRCYQTNIVTPALIGCVEVIVGIIAIVVGGVIYYELVKVCKKYLGPATNS